jgi:glutaredoxin
MLQPNILVYGSRSCPETNRVTRYLDGRDIQYEFKDVDQLPEYNDYIAGLNAGTRVTPTIRLNNETFVNPSDEALGKAVEAATPRL